MKTPRKRKSPSTGGRRFNRDFTGKEFFTSLTSSVTMLDPACTFKGPLSIQLPDRTREKLADLLVEVELDRTKSPWQCVSRDVDMVVMHVEFVDQIRPDLASQLRTYLPLIVNKFKGKKVLVIQHVVVVAKSPQKAPQKALDGGFDRRGRRDWIPVHYIDRLDLGRLSDEDRESPHGHLIAILNPEWRTVDRLRAAAVAVVYEPDGKKLAQLIELIRSIAEIWQDVGSLIYQAVVEENKKMSTRTEQAPTQMSAEERQAMARRTIATMKELPDFQPGLDELVRKEGRLEGRLEGRREGRQEGRQETHVAFLLDILRQRDMKLTDSQEEQLKQMPFKDLPAAALAMDAESAEDFAEQAGLR